MASSSSATHLALDFLNTRSVQNGEPMELLPNFAAVLRWFQAAGLLRSAQRADLEQKWGGSVRARNVTEAMRTLRENIRKEILSWEDTGTVHRSTRDELNRFLAEHPMLTKLQGSTPAAGLWFKATQPEDLFAPLAHNVAMLLASVDHARVRKCGQRVLHFYDTSKKGRRRWCSMKLCGNRLKVAAYAARQRSSASH